MSRAAAVLSGPFAVPLAAGYDQFAADHATDFERLVEGIMEGSVTINAPSSPEEEAVVGILARALRVAHPWPDEAEREFHRNWRQRANGTWGLIGGGVVYEYPREKCTLAEAGRLRATYHRWYVLPQAERAAAARALYREPHLADDERRELRYDYLMSRARKKHLLKVKLVGVEQVLPALVERYPRWQKNRARIARRYLRSCWIGQWRAFVRDRYLATPEQRRAYVPRWHGYEGFEFRFVGHRIEFRLKGQL
jgi:hypothetical protein